MKKYLIIHHDADYDGILSNEVCRHFLLKDGNEVTSIGWDYGKPTPQTDAYNYDQIFMVDISVKELMDKERLPNLIWLDHHKTAIDEFDPSIPGYRIDGVAACRLAWQWFSHVVANKVMGDAAYLPKKEEYINRTVE